MQGIRNVTRALNIAKHNGYNDIIGTLLKHIAQESNKQSLDNKSCKLLVVCTFVFAFVYHYHPVSLAYHNKTLYITFNFMYFVAILDISFLADIVDLSGLSLHKVKPEWILPALGSTTLLQRFSWSPKSFKSVLDSPPSTESPSRHRQNANLYAKPVFELSITGAKSIPFHSKCRMKCTLEQSDSIFPPITDDFCTRARTMRRPPPSCGNSRAPSPLLGIFDVADVRQYLVQRQQDIVSLHISSAETRVRKLNLSCNSLSSLDSLDADGSKSHALHERLRKLEALELYQNNLDDLPEQFFRVSGHNTYSNDHDTHIL